jgi:hypothetical protein
VLCARVHLTAAGITLWGGIGPTSERRGRRLFEMTNEVSNHGPSSADNAYSVVLAEYDPAWPVAFHRESIRLLEAAGYGRP